MNKEIYNLRQRNMNMLTLSTTENSALVYTMYWSEVIRIVWLTQSFVENVMKKMQGVIICWYWINMHF